jgi:serine phosphatase RsbU (regulator of sigma subunit)/CHASE3 domain sensor protein
MRTRNRLIATLLVAVAAGTAAVALGVALLLGNIVHLRATANATLSTGSYLAATINVEREVVDAETGLRGYVITGKPVFLAPTQTAQKQLPSAAATLEQAARQEGAYVARANALADAARAYMTSYVPGVIAEVTSDPHAARSVATTTLGKRLVDGVRLQTQKLEQLISERQAARQRAARSSANTAVTVAVVVLIVLTILTLALGGFLGWLLVGRERARERASFLADASALLDRGTTAEEVLDTFAALALERGNTSCVAEEIAYPDAPELELARANAGDAAHLSSDVLARAEAAWEQAKLTARRRHTTATAAAVLDPAGGGQQVHALALAAVARGSLVARVLLIRRGRGWRQDELEEITGLGARLALTLYARALQTRTEALYRRSEHTARTLQRSLLPTAIPDVRSCELAIRFVPAGVGDLVGGDFYDVFAVGDGRWAVVLGDVCGKGASAAAVTAMARWTLRSFAGSARSPAEVLRALNAAMLRQYADGRFITVVYALLSVREGEVHVTVACAGHPPAIFVSDDGDPATLAAHGDLIGIWPEIRLEQVDLRLRPGESLVLYSDGVTDQGPGLAQSPEHALRSVTAEPTADALADALRDQAERANAPTRDDVAVVVVRNVGTGAGGDRPPAAPARRAGLTVEQPRA